MASTCRRCTLIWKHVTLGCVSVETQKLLNSLFTPHLLVSGTSEGVCLENAYIGHFMFIGVVIIQDRKALNAFYVLMSRDGGRDPAILSARQYFGNFYRMAVELFRPLLFFQYI